MEKEITITPENIRQAVEDLLDEKIELQSRIDKAINFVKTEYNTYPSAEEWRKALLKILDADSND